MSIYAIRSYHRELEKIIHYVGSNKETAIRAAPLVGERGRARLHG